MDFSTKVPIIPASLPITQQHKLLLIGSCFTENIGFLLQYYKFNTVINPFGIVFNPISMIKSLVQIIDKKTYSTEDIFEHNGIFSSWQHHSNFNDTQAERLISRINQSIEAAHYALKEADFLILTFGSAYVYHLKPGYETVSNCHKVPANKFIKKLYEPTEIFEAFQSIYYKLKFFNPHLQLIFTVSPARHLKDGIYENNLSKASLLLAIEKMVATYANAAYFPAYEIVMDELRDYRFFKEDMAHPNEQAVKYVWEKFAETYFTGSTWQLCKEIDNVKRMLQHRPMLPETAAFATFVEKATLQLQALSDKLPNHRWEEEWDCVHQLQHYQKKI
ncbi:MAG: GSCFA domain-containing protein [Chitinophagales bacterium]|nr:GSCFA domain-containing protein [Chitinophagales bacterium]